MISPDDIKCWAFSYDEVEGFLKKYYPNGIIEYDAGGQIWIQQGDTLDVPAVQVLHKVFPEIPEDSICFYPEFGYIYTKPGADVIVIAGLQP